MFAQEETFQFRQRSNNQDGFARKEISDKKNSLQSSDGLIYFANGLISNTLLDRKLCHGILIVP